MNYDLIFYNLQLNLAEDVDENYPIIFSIILFISLALILSLIAITGKQTKTTL